eukprot:GDKI01020711.1.p1 GENE.GDKI01020711.1~~GDKI01020711.1.p1  ORF type:complete len:255 (+),score=59.79 GDKI01020711.1:147-911(+)
MAATTNTPDFEAARRAAFDALNHALSAQQTAVNNVLIEQEQTLKDWERKLKEREEAFEREKEKMVKMGVKGTDIIELDVGGRVFKTTRATLCAQPDTLLAVMFSGRWEDSLHRDPKTGAAFLDCDPDLFAILLNHLRSLQLSPDHPLPSPSLSPEMKETWDAMMRYWGFTKQTQSPPADVSVLCRFSTLYSNTDFQISNDGKTAVRQTQLSWAYAVGVGVVARGEMRIWKMKVLKSQYLYFGAAHSSDELLWKS